ncbi:MAG: pseudouridylate synthase [Prevotellaceae bacterium]|jgi:predicted hotdog family 3-hydroxylacyl-ACP dehydratase|nr:pseudouridylate synthase [Prevotellaceae bacterium]
MDLSQDINVRELLPQKGRFVMIDRLRYFDETTVISSLTVDKDNIFVEDGMFTEPGIIENIAQTAAARMGYIGKYISSEGVKLGFIGEIKNLIIERCPHTGEELTTCAEIVTEIFSTLMIQAKVTVDNELIAHGYMKISIIDSSNLNQNET